jgi:hypothetical protein
MSGPDPSPDYARRPLYAAGSVHGPVQDNRGHRIPSPSPRQVGWVNGYGEAENVAWRWDDPCPRCASLTEYGYCTRCVWTCPNAARPAPEPIPTVADRAA